MNAIKILGHGKSFEINSVEIAILKKHFAMSMHLSSNTTNGLCTQFPVLCFFVAISVNNGFHDVYSTYHAGFSTLQWRYNGRDCAEIISLAIVYSTVYSGADQRKYQSSASLVFVRRIHRGPVNSRNKWPVTRKMFPFDDVIMNCHTEVHIQTK